MLTAKSSSNYVESLQGDSIATEPMKMVRKLINQSSRWLGIIGVLALFLSVNYEVFSRYLFNEPTTWGMEYLGYLVVAITFIGAASALLRGSHVRVTLLTDLLVGSKGGYLEWATRCIGMAAMLLLSWKTAEFVREEYFAGTTSWGMLSTPMWIPMSAVAIGYFGLWVAFVVQMRGLAKTVAPLQDWVGRIVIVAAGAYLYCSSFEVGGVAISSMQAVWLIGGATLLVSLLWGGVRSSLWLCGVALIPILAYLLTQDASVGWKGIALTVVLIYFLATGLEIAFGLTSLALLGLILWMPRVDFTPLAARAWESVHYFEFAAVPMFVFMGSLLVRTDAAQLAFTALRALFGRIPGGLAFSTIGASGIFAAVSGSSIASAATLGRVAGPELVQQGYAPSLSYGLIAAGGTLGILIPPSIALIIYGSLSGVPVTQLFIAGIIPGIVVMLLYALVIVVWMMMNPRSIPSGQAYTLREKVNASRGIMPFLALVIAVLGSLYMGIATPTEAGGVGALAAVLIGMFRRQMSISKVMEALQDTAITTSFLLLIAAGAAHMSFVLDLFTMAEQLVGWVSSLGLSPGWLLVAIVLLYLVLGMFIEPMSMILLTLPVVLPMIAAAGWDPLWFAIPLVVLVEIGLITPPVGMLLFVLQGVTEGKVGINSIAKGTLPFVGALLAAIALFFWFPGLVTWLPAAMSG